MFSISGRNKGKKAPLLVRLLGIFFQLFFVVIFLSFAGIELPGPLNIEKETMLKFLEVYFNPVYFFPIFIVFICAAFLYSVWSTNWKMLEKEFPVHLINRETDTSRFNGELNGVHQTNLFKIEVMDHGLYLETIKPLKIFFKPFFVPSSIIKMESLMEKQGLFKKESKVYILSSKYGQEFELKIHQSEIAAGIEMKILEVFSN